MSYENERVNKLNEQLAELGIKDNEKRDLHNTLVYLDLLINSHDECCCSIELSELPHEFLATNTSFSEQLCRLQSDIKQVYYLLFERKWYCGNGPADIFLKTEDDVVYTVRINGPSKLHYPKPHEDVLFAERIGFLGECFTYPLRKGFNTKSARKL